MSHLDIWLNPLESCQRDWYHIPCDWCFFADSVLLLNIPFSVSGYFISMLTRKNENKYYSVTLLGRKNYSLAMLSFWFLIEVCLLISLSKIIASWLYSISVAQVVSKRGVIPDISFHKIWNSGVLYCYVNLTITITFLIFFR